MGNPIAKNLNKFNKPSFVPDKRQEEYEKEVEKEFKLLYKELKNKE